MTEDHGSCNFIPYFRVVEEPVASYMHSPRLLRRRDEMMQDERGRRRASAVGSSSPSGGEERERGSLGSQRRPGRQ